MDAKNQLMVDAFQGIYLIQLDADVWGWGVAGSDFPSVEGVPVFYRLDANGRATGDWIDANAWGDNIPENMAPPLKEFFHRP